VASLGLERHVVDRATYDRTVGRFREAGILLPTFAQLAAPGTIPAGMVPGAASCANVGSRMPASRNRPTVRS